MKYEKTRAEKVILTYEGRNTLDTRPREVQEAVKHKTDETQAHGRHKAGKARGHVEHEAHEIEEHEEEKARDT